MMALADHDNYFTRVLTDTSDEFARRPSNHNAAALLRAVLIAGSADLISDEEHEDILFDIIDYFLEGHKMEGL